MITCTYIKIHTFQNKILFHARDTLYFLLTTGNISLIKNKLDLDRDSYFFFRVISLHLNFCTISLYFPTKQFWGAIKSLYCKTRLQRRSSWSNVNHDFRTYWVKIVCHLHCSLRTLPSPHTPLTITRSLSSRSRIIQAFRYIRAWLADFDIKCERANTRSTAHSTYPSLSVSLLSFCSYHSIPAGLGCFTLLGSFIRAPLSFRVLIGNNSKMIPDAMLYARKYSVRNLISTMVLLCKV